MIYRHKVALVASAIGITMLACGGSPARNSSDDAGADFNDGGGGGGAGGAGGAFGGAGGGGGSGGGVAGGLIYAHTNSTLYTVDPANVTAAPVRVGNFDCISKKGGGASAMTDFAVAKDGSLYGVSEIAAYPLSIQGSSVHCDATWKLPSTQDTRFYALTMAPEGTVDAHETLIAANGGGVLYRIDAQTGNTTNVGNLGTDSSSGLPWSLSGDIVFLANGGSPVGFATVRTCGGSGSGGTSCDKVDTLVEVDVGAIKPGAGSVLKTVRGKVHQGSSCAKSGGSFGALYGIAAFADQVFGFSHNGEIFTINNADASACLLNSDSSTAWSGAGVTTIAHIVAPPIH